MPSAAASAAVVMVAATVEGAMAVTVATAAVEAVDAVCPPAFEGRLGAHMKSTSRAWPYMNGCRATKPRSA